MSDCLQTHGLQPARLLCPRDSPGQNTGAGCHFLLQQIFWPRNWTWVSSIAGIFFISWATREAPIKGRKKERKWSCSVMSNSLWPHGHQAPPSMGFSRQEYWSGLPFPSPGNFPTQGSNPGLPHCRQTRNRLSHQGMLWNQGSNPNRLTWEPVHHAQHYTISAPRRASHPPREGRNTTYNSLLSSNHKMAFY